MKVISSILAPALALFFLVGCAGSNASTPAKVSGKISYKGKPIKGGTMQFVTPDGTGYSGIITPDGTYSCNDLPAGEMVVTVETESLKPANMPNTKEAKMRMGMAQKPPPGMGGAPQNIDEVYVKIPEKYKNAKTSTAQVTLSKGRNVKDIDLTD